MENKDFLNMKMNLNLFRLLKQKNNELFEENIRLQQKRPLDSKHLRSKKANS